MVITSIVKKLWQKNNFTQPLPDNASKALQQEVSSPPGNRASAIAHTTTHTHTHMTDGHQNLETESAQWANSVKMKCIRKCIAVKLPLYAYLLINLLQYDNNPILLVNIPR